MRTKEQILSTYEDEVTYIKADKDLNAAVQGHIFLEVLIDIRDQFVILTNDLGAMVTTLENIETSIKQRN